MRSGVTVIDGDNRRSHRGFSIIREDPFGFWRVESPHKDFKQSFTMIQMARSAVDEHMKKNEDKDKKAGKTKTPE